MIEIAMAEARRRHRRSIAKAVEQLQEPPVGALNPSAEVYVPQGHQTWDSVASPFQSQIDQAITSAYQTHCQMEQQSYEYYGDNVENTSALWQDPGHGYNSLGSCQAPQYNTQCMVNGNCISQNDHQSGYYSTQEGYGVSNQGVQNEWSQSNNCYPSTATNLYSNSTSSQQQSGYCSTQEDYGVSNQSVPNEWSQSNDCYPNATTNSYSSQQGFGYSAHETCHDPQYDMQSMNHGSNYQTGQQGQSYSTQEIPCQHSVQNWQSDCNQSSASSQVNAIHSCGYGTGNTEGYDGWGQENNCFGATSGQGGCMNTTYQGSMGQTSMDAHSQIYEQTACNQYSQDSCNQGASWHYGGNTWTGHGESSICDNYASYQ